jgi:hypothetical protein
MLNDRKVPPIYQINEPEEKKKKNVDLIDNFGGYEDHVDETSDELPE